MTEFVELPVNLEDCRDPEGINARLRTGAAELDWTRVTVAPAPNLSSLLDGLDLSKDADALGLETIPEELEDEIVEILEAVTPRPNAPGAGRAPTGDAPQVWTAEREPLEEPEAESEPAEEIVEEKSRLTVPPQHQIRDELEKAVICDLLGPAGGPEEEVTERRVSERYLAGMLAPPAPTPFARGVRRVGRRWSRNSRGWFLRSLRAPGDNRLSFVTGSQFFGCGRRASHNADRPLGPLPSSSERHAQKTGREPSPHLEARAGRGSIRPLAFSRGGFRGVGSH